MLTKSTEDWINTESMASISPLIIAGAALIRLGWEVAIQYYAGLNLADIWQHWLLQLVIGG